MFSKCEPKTGRHAPDYDVFLFQTEEYTRKGATMITAKQVEELKGAMAQVETSYGEIIILAIVGGTRGEVEINGETFPIIWGYGTNGKMISCGARDICEIYD